jgi:hypothetical protein
MNAVTSAIGNPPKGIPLIFVRRRTDRSERQGDNKRKKRVRWLCARARVSTDRQGLETKRKRGGKAEFDLVRTLVPGEAYRVYRMRRRVGTRSRDSYKLLDLTNSRQAIEHSAQSTAQRFRLQRYGKRQGSQ